VRLIGFTQPVGNRRFDLVAVRDPQHVGELRPRPFHHITDLRRLDRPSEHHPDLEVFRLRAHEEIADLPRKHDRVVRGVYSLLAEFQGGLAQAFPRVPQVFGEFRRQRPFGRRPAIVRFAFLNPLFTVETLAAGHASILWTSTCGHCRFRPPKGVGFIVIGGSLH
jgi:hypothetical protein